jgi:hypothetical protein
MAQPRGLNGLYLNRKRQVAPICSPIMRLGQFGIWHEHQGCAGIAWPIPRGALPIGLAWGKTGDIPPQPVEL